jgi:hypothetical protein
MAAGIRTGVGLFSMTEGKKQGAACIGGNPTIPIFVELEKPKTAFAVENVIRFAISVAIG